MQAISSLLIAKIVTTYNLGDSQRNFGSFCAVFTAVPSLIAACCFYRAGIFYKLIMTEKDKERLEAIEKASEV